MACRMRRLGMILTALQALSTPTFAAEVPRYDVEAWCEQVSNAGGGSSAMIYNGCFDQEQDAYTSLKQDWARVPAKTQHWCNQVAKSGGGGSYMILKGCIDQEVDATQERGGKAFKY